MITVASELILVYPGIYISLLPSMKCILALFSVCLFFFCDVAVVGVGGSVQRDQSALAQTAPQQAGFGSQTVNACFFSLGSAHTERLRAGYQYYS